MAFRLFRSATSCAAALALTVPLGTPQASAASQENECKYVTAKRGQGAEIVPNDDVRPEDLEQFKYFLNRQTGLLEPFTVEEEAEKRCIAAIPAFEQAASQAAASTAAAGPAAGVAPGTLAAGSIPGAIGAGAVGLGIISIAIGTIAITSGGSNTSTTSTVNPTAE